MPGRNEVQSAMKQADQPSKIAFVSDYLPRKCGIATFTHELRAASYYDRQHKDPHSQAA